MRPDIILLVEDEPILRRLLCESLVDDGFSVETAQNADGAWEMVCRGVEFDILVTDVRMPGQIDGIDLARRVNSRRRGVRIVVMSGFVSPDAFDRRLGSFIRKPFTPAKLAALLSHPDE